MNALVTIETLTPAIVFAPGGVEGIISKLETEVRATPRDIGTHNGREAVKALAYKVARSKTALDEMGKDLVADIKKQSGAIDAERRIIRERLDALRDEVRGPLTAWEEAETARVDGYEREIVWIIESPRFATTPTANMIRAQISDLSGLDDRDWQEFGERANAAMAEARAVLQAMLAATIQAEADAAELAELRRLKTERDEQDAKAAWQKAENERMQKAAEMQAEIEVARAEQEKAREIARAERVEAEKVAAAGRAVEMERQRVANIAAAEKAAADKREANKRHRAKIHQEITLALSEVLTGNADEAGALIEAIAAGRIPHVSITY